MTCKPLHIPYKYIDPTDPTFMDKQKANWLAIERWSDYLIKTCLCDCGETGGSTMTAGTGCGFITYEAVSSFNVTGFEIVVDFDEGSDIEFTFFLNGVGMETFNYTTGDPTPVTYTSTTTYALTPGDNFQIGQTEYQGTITIHIDQPGLDNTLSWSGCG